MRNFQEGRNSFNKIQSWLQELDEIEHTQRMLLSGSSRIFSGSKLKNKNILSDKKYGKGNLLEINNQSKVFKISQTQTTWMSKTFTTFKNPTQFNLGGTGIHSQQVSPKTNYSSYFSKTQLNNKLRRPLTINTKQFSLKLKRVTRPQSYTQNRKSDSPKKQKIKTVLGWKGEIIELKNGRQTNKKDLIINDNFIKKKKLKTSPSAHDQKQQDVNEKRNVAILLKKKIVQKTLNQRNKSFKSVTNSKLQTTIKKSQKLHINPRVKLQIQIAQKQKFQNRKKYFIPSILRFSSFISFLFFEYFRKNFFEIMQPQ